METIYDVDITSRIESELKQLDVEPAFCENALKILEKRYLMKDDDGQAMETPKDMLARVAANISYADMLYGASYDQARDFAKTLYTTMSRLELLPNSPTLRGAGRETQQLSACFVLPVEDSRQSIFSTLRDAVDIQAHGGGTGFNFSHIRPKGSRVMSTGGEASGPISFMEIYDIAVGRVIAQGGVRQGANMGILAYDHPDIMDFIDCKMDGKTLSNFNISVGVTEEFMEMAENNMDYDLIDPHTKEIVGQLNAQEVLDKIAQNAWSTGDPGLIFLDRIDGANPTPHIGVMESTNPCGEQPLLPYESCNLGSINLARMVREEDGKVVMDYEKLADTVRNGVHLLDNVIDMNRYPLEKIEEMTKGNRKIGMGVMGWADLLAMMGVPYNSEQALGLAEEVMEFINTSAKAASVELAKTRGVFPNFKNSIYDTGAEEDMVRNASWTTIAPTGTLSILSDCNGGIEPFFMLVYLRGSIYDAEGKPTVELLMENETFKRIAVERGFYSEELAMKIAETGSMQHVDEVPDDIREIFVTSHDIEYEWHIKMQAAFQKHITNAVSKTINFPNNATVADIKESYQLAHTLSDIKGITVYRDGCKEYQVLSARDTSEDIEPTAVEDIADRLKSTRPRKIAGTTERIETPVGTLFVTINSADGSLYEVFLNIGKAGADVTADAEGYGRLLSMIFKAGIPPKMVIDQLRGIGGSGSIGFGKQRVRSLPDAIARVLEIYLEENPAESYGSIAHESKISGNMCPECGNMLVFEEGCSKCKNCGYSRC
ncbi:vitamin B12-dependent ribonucleotide reductase [Candidatus Poribacteria bacterium]